MKLQTINDINVFNKYVLLRDDFNVQIIDGKITDTFRIEQSMPTIEKLRSGGAKVVICAHLGRPKGVRDDNLSLKPIAEYMKIPFVKDCLNKDFLQNMHMGDVVLLENLRFYDGEEENNIDFAKQLSIGYDIYVNDAFAVSHRAHASTVGVTQFLPSYAGLLLQSEIEHLDAMMNTAEHPLVSIVGGSKISTKIGVLKTLAKLSDTLILGGALGTTFNYALGANVGNSLYEPDCAKIALDILHFATEHNCKVLLPLDKGVAKKYSMDARRVDTDIDNIAEDDIILDEGPKTNKRNADEIKRAKTVIWNGTVGMAEWAPVWSVGSFAIANTLAEQTRQEKLKSFVGGGDTVACLEASNTKSDMTYVSTGGGAFLEFIEGKTLPGIQVLYK